MNRRSFVKAAAAVVVGAAFPALPSLTVFTGTGFITYRVDIHGPDGRKTEIDQEDFERGHSFGELEEFWSNLHFSFTRNGVNTIRYK